MKVKIENDIQTPKEVEKPKSRARKQASRKTKGANPASYLLKALKFISHAQKKTGAVNVQYCQVCNNWVAAFDGILTIAHPIEEDLNACPHTFQLIDALSKVEKDLSITHLGTSNLVISSEFFRALIPCANSNEIFINPPDEQIVQIDDCIKAGFSAVQGLAVENHEFELYTAVFLKSGSMVATNGAALLEFWHGFELPATFMIPKAATVAISKSPYSLVGLGFSESSATFYFENGAFIKTQLHDIEFPDFESFFDVENLNPIAISDDFFKAVRAVEAFSKDGNVFFKNEAVLSNERKEKASSYKIENLPEGMGFSAKFLFLIEHAFKKVHFDKKDSKVVFFAENLRGVLKGLTLKEEVSYIIGEEEIPF